MTLSAQFGGPPAVYLPTACGPGGSADPFWTDRQSTLPDGIRSAGRQNWRPSRNFKRIRSNHKRFATTGRLVSCSCPRTEIHVSQDRTTEPYLPLVIFGFPCSDISNLLMHPI